MRLTINLLYPCLILQFIIGNDALKDPTNVVFSLGLGYGTAALGFAVAYLVATLAKMRVGKGRRTFAFSAGLFNYGYIPIPVIALIFPEGATAGVLLVFNVGVEASIWTLGILVLTGEIDRNAWKKIFNPPVMAMFLGLGLNYLGVTELSGFAASVWQVADTTIMMLGACAIPLGVMLGGATAADLVQTGEWKGGWNVPILALFTRLALLPALFIVIALLLPISVELKRVLAVQAAMPAAMLPIALSRFLGGSPAVAVKVVLSTTIVSMFTIPLVFGLGLELLGVK